MGELEQEQEFTGEDTTDTIKLFGKWDVHDIEIADMSLEDYIACKGSHATYLPHTAGRYQLKRFRKASCPIVERIMGSIAFHGRNTGEKLKAMRIMKQTLDIIH